jgi:threonine aldolase
MYGGGMRQVGILAAGGLYALRNHRSDLARDHRNARRLADGLARIPAFSLNPERVETNIVMFDVVDGDALTALERMRGRGVLMVPFGPRTIRATLHRDLANDVVDRVVEILEELFEKEPRTARV